MPLPIPAGHRTGLANCYAHFAQAGALCLPLPSFLLSSLLPSFLPLPTMSETPECLCRVISNSEESKYSLSQRHLFSLSFHIKKIQNCTLKPPRPSGWLTDNEGCNIHVWKPSFVYLLTHSHRAWHIVNWSILGATRSLVFNLFRNRFRFWASEAS